MHEYGLIARGAEVLLRRGYRFRRSTGKADPQGGQLPISACRDDKAAAQPRKSGSRSHRLSSQGTSRWSILSRQYDSLR